MCICEMRLGGSVKTQEGRVMAMTGTDKFQLLDGEERGERQKKQMEEKRKTTEGNASFRPYNPGNEALSSARETRLRDSSTAATQERER